MSAMRCAPRSWMRAASCVARGVGPVKKPHRLWKPGSHDTGFSARSLRYRSRSAGGRPGFLGGDADHLTGSLIQSFPELHSTHARSARQERACSHDSSRDTPPASPSSRRTSASRRNYRRISTRTRSRAASRSGKRPTSCPSAPSSSASGRTRFTPTSARSCRSSSPRRRSSTCGSRSSGTASFLLKDGAARQAREAWRLVHQWRIGTGTGTEDAAAFSAGQRNTRRKARATSTPRACRT